MPPTPSNRPLADNRHPVVVASDLLFQKKQLSSAFRTCLDNHPNIPGLHHTDPGRIERAQIRDQFSAALGIDVSQFQPTNENRLRLQKIGEDNGFTMDVTNPDIERIFQNSQERGGVSDLISEFGTNRYVCSLLKNLAVRVSKYADSIYNETPDSYKFCEALFSLESSAQSMGEIPEHTIEIMFGQDWKRLAEKIKTTRVFLLNAAQVAQALDMPLKDIRM